MEVKAPLLVYLVLFYVIFTTKIKVIKMFKRYLCFSRALILLLHAVQMFLVSFNRDDLCNDACVMLYCLKAKKKYSFIINTKYPNDMQKKCTP